MSSYAAVQILANVFMNSCFQKNEERNKKNKK